jgi:3-keto-L-gulonate-6-phosphate decarboxylase
MKFHISFDQTDLENALRTAAELAAYTNVFEVSSLLLYKHGIEAVQRFTETFPEHTILADTKIVDHGKDTVSLFSDTSAKWLTAMAGTHKDIIFNTCTSAHNQNKMIMLDLLDSSSLNQSALVAESLGVDALRFRQPYQIDQAEFLENWDMVRGNTKLPIYLATRITRDQVGHIEKIKPNGLILGTTITQASNPAEEAEFFNKFCETL